MVARADTRGLVDELRRAHRLTLAVLMSVLVLSLASSGYLLMVGQPRVDGLVRLGEETRDLHEGMLDQETGLRAWLATGDGRFLAPYRSGDRHAESAADQLLSQSRANPDVAPAVLRMLLTRQQWMAWSTTAARSRYTARQRTDGTLTSFLLQGKAQFDAFRVAEGSLRTTITRSRQHALTQQACAMTAALVGFLLLLLTAAVCAGIGLRRVRRRVVAPLEDLRETVVALRAGQLSARPAPTDVPELAQIGSALTGLATQLTAAGVDATARERRLAKLAYRFETVVRVGRQIAGSLSSPYVAATVTSAAAELLNTSTVLWLRSEDGVFEVTHRSRDPHGMVASTSQVAPAVVAQAAATARPTSETGRSAYPLVLAGTVTAVLEVATSEIGPDTDQVLTALLSTAAASLESAHLHTTAQQLAHVDGLTGLPNRRRFEADIRTEWDRCRRYDRPMSIAMLDLDHFKRLNDDHGHLLGDEVLRTVASVVTGVLRTTDTAYRYGGEEIVILLSETGLQDGLSAAERVRAAIASVSLPDHPRVSVSGSLGVATRLPRMATYTEVVAQADGALYEAKRAGRDRVVAAHGDLETLVSGPPDGPLVPHQALPR